eukprot:6045843-Prymnesium_polylepis.2
MLRCHAAVRCTVFAGNRLPLPAFRARGPAGDVKQWCKGCGDQFHGPATATDHAVAVVPGQAARQPLPAMRDARGGARLVRSQRDVRRGRGGLRAVRQAAAGAAASAVPGRGRRDRLRRHVLPRRAGARGVGVVARDPRAQQGRPGAAAR